MSSQPSAVAQEELGAEPVEGNPTPPQSAPSSGRRGIVGTLQIVGVVAALALAVGFSRESTPAAAATTPPVTPPDVSANAPAVSVMVPTLAATAINVEATGSVVVRNRVQMVPEVTGRVISVAPALRDGGRFVAGEELLRIDTRELNLALRQANADLAVARSQLRLRQAEADAARTNYAILHPGKPVPPLVAKVPQLEQSRAQVAAAEARVAIAQLALSRTRFALPFDGQVTHTEVAVGQVLNAGQSFGQAFAADAVEIAVPVSEAELAKLQPVVGRTAQVTTATGSYTAIVDRAAAELDERTRFATLYLQFDQPEMPPPGTFVDVTVAGPTLADTFVLPFAAEQSNGRVWVARDGVLRAVTPTVMGRTTEGLVVNKFDAGDGVVLGAMPTARDGLSVRLATTNS